MGSKRYDLIVVGAGPGGYVCAIRAAQFGMKVACVEKRATLGGVCLNVGCIPSKALLESSERYVSTGHDLAAHGVIVDAPTFDLSTMMGRKDAIVDQLTSGVDGLFKKNKIDRIVGTAKVVGAGAIEITDAEGAVSTLNGDTIVLATGSTPVELRGVSFDGDRIGSSTEALAYPEVPEHLIVIGAGVIGLELGSVWGRLGSKVTVLEYLDRIMAGSDSEIAKLSQRLFTKQGMTFRLGARVTGATVDGDRVTVTWQDSEGASHEEVGDRVLLSVGRRPHTEGLGCEDTGIALDERGRIKVDHNYQTTIAGIFAIGDVIEGPMLAHKAEDEGVAVAEIIAGQDGHVNYRAIPGIVYTHPEVASVGVTEDTLKADGVPYNRGRYKFAPNGRALALGETDGLVKILAHKETDEILGCHIVGPRAGDLIAEVVIAMEFGATAEDLARSVHAHPTLSEVIREAAMDVDRRAIHK